MGASFNTVHVKAQSNKELEAWYRKHIDRLYWEYGHSGYNGTFTTCSGLLITSEVFDDSIPAEDWLCDNTEKRGLVKAVKVNKTPDDISQDHYYWILGGWCAE